MENIEKFSTVGRSAPTIRAFGFLYEAAVAQFSKERVETKNISIDFTNGYGVLAGEVKESEEITESEFYVTDPVYDEEGNLLIPMTTSIRLRGKNRSLYGVAILLSYGGEPISLVINYFSPETTARYAIENGVKDDIKLINNLDLIADKKVVYRNLQDFPVNDLFDVDKLHTYVESGRDKTPIGERIKRSKHNRTKTS